MAMKCPSCGADNPDGKKFCGDCGKALPQQLFRMCMKCGRSINWDSNLCPYCGYRLPAMKKPAGSPQKKT